MKTEKNWRI